MGNFGSKEEKELTAMKNEWNILQTEDKQKYKQENFSVALAVQNIEKNRYVSVLAPDVSRVKLSEQKGSQSDYINANYVDGIHDNSKHAYIATQAPKQETLADFWRMVWEQNIYILVMLTNLVENGKQKAHQYWPKQGSKKYGNLLLTLVETPMSCDDWLIRKFTLKLTTNNLMMSTMTASNEVLETREIYQFHYVTWPDMGVPEVGPILDLMKVMDEYYENQVLPKIQNNNNNNKTNDDVVKSPLLVHCSAGIGRTGAFCVCHSVIKKYKSEKIDQVPKVNLQPILSTMRDQRSGFVQQPSQYIFCYKTIDTALTAHLGVPTKDGKIKKSSSSKSNKS